MKLTTRFSLSHGGVVALGLLISFFLTFAGTRLFYQRQARLAQEQQLSDLAQATKEALMQHQDVAVLNFMRLTLKNPMAAYAAYTNFSTGVHVVLPASYQKETFSRERSGKPHIPLHRRFSDGLEALEWSSPVEDNGKLAGQVWLGYSQAALDKELREQTGQWLGLEAAAAAAALIAGLLISFWLGRHLALPLRKIREGTHLVRAGKLDSLVDVDRPDEIGDLSRDFNSMVLQLKELDEMKRDFMAGVTHDLGTPLQAVRSAINYLQAGDAGPLTEQQAEYLLMVSNSTANLTAFINNLLTAARIEAGKVEPFPEPVDVFAHVKEIVDLYQLPAREKGVKLALVKKAHYISLVADVTMFRQIVLNLLSNALKFTNEGEVDVLLWEEDGDFVLEVRDTGIGIDPQYHQLVFEKFFRVHQPAGSPARQGSGLGLTIVKGLVEANGGKIVMRSELGKGSDFKVSLPKQPRRF